MSSRKKTATETSPGEANGDQAATAVLNPPTDAPPVVIPGATVAPEANGNGNGNGEKKSPPCFKVGPIPTDKDHAVAACVWANTIAAQDGRTFTVYSMSVESRYFDPAFVNEGGEVGAWKPIKSFRGSQLGALLWCIHQCETFIYAASNPANKDS